MSATTDRAIADPQLTIADLRRELAASNAERDEALRHRLSYFADDIVITIGTPSFSHIETSDC